MSNTILKDRPSGPAGCASHLAHGPGKESPGTRPGLEDDPDLRDLGIDYLHCVGAYLVGSVPAVETSPALPAVTAVAVAQAQSTLIAAFTPLTSAALLALGVSVSVLVAAVSWVMPPVAALTL